MKKMKLEIVFRILVINILLFSCETKIKKTNNKVSEQPKKISSISKSIEVDELISIKDVKYISDIKVFKDFTYTIGYSYREDGNGQTSILKKFDSDFNQIWSLNIDDLHYNSFRNLEVLGNNIFIHGVQGINNQNTYNYNHYVYNISLDGELKNKIKIGKSSGRSTNLIIDNQTLWVGLTQFENRKRTSSIVSYDLNTKKIKTYKSTTSKVLVNNLVKSGSSIIAFCNYEGKVFDRIYTIKITNDKIKEKLLDFGKREYYISSLSLNDNEILIYSYQNYHFEKEEMYLRQTIVDNDLNIKRSIVIPTTNLDIDAPTQYGYFENSDFWVLSKKNEINSYLKIDINGELKEKFELKKSNNDRAFIVNKNRIIEKGERGIIIMKLSTDG